MSGMKSFKFPGIIKKRKAVSHGLPTFDLGKVTNLRELGFGSFDSVHLGDYVCGVEIQSVVVKKLKPVFHWAEFCARSVIFRQNFAATKLKAVQLLVARKMSLHAQNSA